MSQTRSLTTDPPEIEVVSTSTQTTTVSPSSFYAMLPGLVRERIPALPSIRRSLTTHASRASLTEQGRSQSADLTDYQLCSGEARASGLRSAPAEMVGSNGGWKYTNQGLTLLESAIAEAQYPDENSRVFARQLYIHSLTYLLRGLPEELSSVEVASLRTALPIALQNHENKEPDAIEPNHPPTQPPSLLHRLLASGIVQLFVFFRVVLPYLRTVLQSAYQYERTHHLSERAFASGIAAADRVGRRGAGLMDTLLSSGNGKMGGLLVATIVWWIEGISGGINEGVGQGMAILGKQDPSPPLGRR